MIPEPQQLPDGYRQRVETYTRQMMNRAHRLFDIVREFAGEQYIAQAQEDGLTVRIYKGNAPDCLKCNDRRWIVEAREQKEGIIVPVLNACDKCNADGMAPPPMEKAE